MIRLARIHHPVTALGPGRRVALWVQGCGLSCHGCMSRDTWDPASGTAVPVPEVMRLLGEAYDSDATLRGLTVSGGEPLEQPGAVRELLAWLRATRPDVDTLTYTGWSLARVRREADWVLAEVDALVPEPFVAHRAPGARWRGSSNQPMLLLTELGQRRHERDGTDGPPVQVAVTGGRLTLIGVPGPNDLERMVAAARARGLEVEEVSWTG